MSGEESGAEETRRPVFKRVLLKLSGEALMGTGEFGIDPGDIAIVYADSTAGALSAGPGGSRLTVMLSGAARGASRNVRDKMIRIAAHAMEMAPEDVECVEGTFRAKGAPGTSMTMGEVAMRAHLFAHDNPEGEYSGLIDVYTYDHPYATPPSADN